MSADFYASPDPDVRRKIRSRRRRRKAVTGVIRFAFWLCVLSGVFVLGLGYGRTLSGDTANVNKRVTFTGSTRTIEATLPTRTVTITKAVKVASKKRSG